MSDPPSSPLPRSPVSITNQPYINTNTKPRSLALFTISRSEIETETETEEREKKMREPSSVGFEGNDAVPPQALLQRLKDYDQEHAFALWYELSYEEREYLVQDIEVSFISSYPIPSLLLRIRLRFEFGTSDLQIVFVSFSNFRSFWPPYCVIFVSVLFN